MGATCCREKYIGCLCNASHFSHSISAFGFSFLYSRNEKLLFCNSFFPERKKKSIHFKCLLCIFKKEQCLKLLRFAKSTKECQRFQYGYFSLISPKARLSIHINIIALYCCICISPKEV